MVCHVARRSIRPLVDRILHGRLHALISERLAAGDSFEQVARWLAAEHDIEVTGETVRRWWHDYQLPVDEVAS